MKKNELNTIIEETKVIIIKNAYSNKKTKKKKALFLLKNLEKTRYEKANSVKKSLF